MIQKVERIISFFRRQVVSINNYDGRVDVTFVIACLQSIVLSDSNEIFDYRFPGYKKKSSSFKRVQAAVKHENEENEVYDALQCRFVNVVRACWLLNLGVDNKEILRIENICDSILREILYCSDVESMLIVHNYYRRKFNNCLILTDFQVKGIEKIRDYLKTIKFDYIDKMLDIRKLFTEYSMIDSNLTDILDVFDAYISEGKDCTFSVEYECLGSNAKEIIEFKMDFQLNIKERYIELVSVFEKFSDDFYDNLRKYEITLV